MATRNIIKIGEETLRKKSRPVTDFDDRLHQLLDDMADTMYEAKGAGLAAVQVGVLRRVVTIDTGDGLIELVNPVIVSSSGREVCDEGCLSIPGESARIARPRKVKVKAQDRDGKEFCFVVTDYAARAVCHELDHLDGVLYVDLIDPALQTGEDE